MILKIEAKAVNFMEDSFEACEKIQTIFESASSIPLTDGELLVYNQTNYSNENLAARIRVQIKGQEVKKFGEKYSIKKTYLTGLKSSGGVLFLVTQMIKTGTKIKKRGFYKHLSPADIDRILSLLKPGRASISISLTPLPHDPHALERIARLAAEKIKQAEPTDFTNDIAEITRSLHISTSELIDISKPLWFGGTGIPAAISADIEPGITIPITGEIAIIPEYYFPQATELTVRAGMVELDDVKHRLMDETTYELFLSPGIKLTNNTETLTGTVTYARQDRIDLAIKDVQFLKAWNSTGKISFNGNSVDLKLANEFITPEIESRHQILSDINQLFVELGADISLIDQTSLDRNTLEKLQPIVNHVINQSILELPEQRPMRYQLPIGGWSLQLVLFPKSYNLKTQVVSITDPEMGAIAVRDSEKKIQTVTAFELLDPQQISEAINLHLDSIRLAYDTRVSEEDAVTLANQTVLKLILAADLQPRRRRELIDAAKSLNEWIRIRDGGELTTLINEAQILWRQGQCFKKTCEDIRDRSYRITGIDDDAFMTRAGISVVLGESEATEYALIQMTEQSRENFLRLPIAYMHSNYTIATDYFGPTRDEEVWIPVLDSAREEFFRNAISKMPET